MLYRTECVQMSTIFLTDAQRQTAAIKCWGITEAALSSFHLYCTIASVFLAAGGVHECKLSYKELQKVNSVSRLVNG